MYVQGMRKYEPGEKSYIHLCVSGQYGVELYMRGGLACRAQVVICIVQAVLFAMVQEDWLRL